MAVEQNESSTSDAADEVCVEDAGQPLLYSVREKFLLSIIDAHTIPKEGDLSLSTRLRRRDERLRAATKALFNVETARGRPSDFHTAALLWMASEHQKDQWRSQRYPLGPKAPVGTKEKERSVRQLAELAAKKFFPEKQGSVFEVLRKDFSKHKISLILYSQTHDDIPENFDAQTLDSIRKALALAHIEMKPAATWSSLLGHEEWKRADAQPMDSSKRPR